MSWLSDIWETVTGQKDREKAYKKERQAREQYEEWKGFTKPISEQGKYLATTYTRPAFQQAYSLASQLGQTPALYSGYNLALQNLANQMARMGLSQSGISQASQRALLAQRAQQAAETQYRAKLGQQQALRDLALSALQAGLSGAGALGQMYSPIANLYLQRAQQHYKSAGDWGQMWGGLGQLAGQALSSFLF